MIKIFRSSEEVNRFAADKICEIADVSIASKGHFTIALAGGSTPRTLYQCLAGEKYKNKIDWSKTFFFFGDERLVMPDAEESNFRMADESLFKPLYISPDNVFRWQTEFDDVKKIAVDYEKKIRDFFKLAEDEFPRLDLILLGMGADGHTASLFPFSEALNETEKIAAVNPVDKLETVRLTLTFPAINNAANIAFLVTSAEKAETVKEVLTNDFQPERLPSQAVKPRNGNLFWLIDNEAGKFLI